MCSCFMMVGGRRIWSFLKKELFVAATITRKTEKHFISSAVCARQTHVFKTGDFFAIEPNTVHTFRYLENTLLLGFYDLGVEKMSGGGVFDIFSMP